MNNCLNILESPEVFILTATLIVLVLLVWVQLRGKPERDFNFVCGIVWTYVAILFTLAAVGFFVWAKSPGVSAKLMNCAKGSLILSFLMTVFNVALGILLIVIKMVFMKPFDESLTKVGRDCLKRTLWILFWLLSFGSLFIISLSIVGILPYNYLLIGAKVFCLDFIYAGIVIVSLKIRDRIIRRRSYLIRNIKDKDD